MNLKIKKGDFVFLGYILLLFLAFLNLLNIGNYIFIGLFIIAFLITRTIILNKEVIFLIFFGITYSAVFIYNFGGSILDPTILLYLIFPTMGYYLGNIGGILCKRYGKNLHIVIYAVGTGLFLHGFLNMMSFGQSSFVTREIKDYWTDILFKATGQSMYYIVVIGMVFYAIKGTKNFWEKVMILSANGMIIYFALQTSTRTPIFLILVIVFFGICLYLYTNAKNVRKFLFWGGFICILLIAIYVAYQMNMGSIKDIYENSNLGQRMSTLSNSYKENDPRISAQIYVIKHLFDYPLGGCKLLLPMNEGTFMRMEFAHSLWLDTVYRVGILPFFFIVCYTIEIIKKSIKVFKSKTIINETKYFLLPITVAIFLQYALEPIMEGMIWLFVAGCFINGCLNQLSYKKKEA